MKVTKFICVSAAILMFFSGCSNNVKNKDQVQANKILKSEEMETPNSKGKIQEKQESNAGSTSDNKPANVNTSLPNSSKTDAEPKGKIVVIDPGHANRSNLNKEANAPGSSLMKIKDGGGAAGVVTRTPEYLINMEVAMSLKKLLEAKGFKVIMTKTSNAQSLGNIERAEIGNKAGADLVIRIHCDSNGKSSAVGASMLVPQAINESTKKIYGESKRCGQIVLNTLTNIVGMRNRGLIFSKDMTGFNWSKVPVILVEMGFLSNPGEDKLLSSPNYQDKLAKALAEGIDKALK